MAGSKKDSFETAILRLVLCNVAIAGIGDANGILGSTAAGNLYLALYKVVPSDSAQGTETTYTNYARIPISRAEASWSIANGQASNTGVLTFPTCGATGDTIVGAAICKGATVGVDDQIYWADCGSITIGNGVPPEFAIGAITLTED